jgi:hypothetical protein
MTGRRRRRAQLPPDRNRFVAFPLFVTLDKTGMQDEHRYEDVFLSPTEFRWQSQNRTARDSKMGQRLKNHRAESTHVHLFVRPTAKVGGKTQPFTYCGELEFEPPSVPSFHVSLRRVAKEFAKALEHVAEKCVARDSAPGRERDRPRLASVGIDPDLERSPWPSHGWRPGLNAVRLDRVSVFGTQKRLERQLLRLHSRVAQHDAKERFVEPVDRRSKSPRWMRVAYSAANASTSA